MPQAKARSMPLTLILPVLVRLRWRGRRTGRRAGRHAGRLGLALRDVVFRRLDPVIAVALGMKKDHSARSLFGPASPEQACGEAPRLRVICLQERLRDVLAGLAPRRIPLALLSNPLRPPPDLMLVLAEEDVVDEALRVVEPARPRADGVGQRLDVGHVRERRVGRQRSLPMH